MAGGCGLSGSLSLSPENVHLSPSASAYENNNQHRLGAEGIHSPSVLEVGLHDALGEAPPFTPVGLQRGGEESFCTGIHFSRCTISESWTTTILYSATFLLSLVDFCRPVSQVQYKDSQYGLWSSHGSEFKHLQDHLLLA